MPRAPKPRWHAGNQQWVSDVGPEFVDAKGRTRRRTVPFPGIGRKEEKRARDALQGYLDAQAVRQQNATDPTVEKIFEEYLLWYEANREPTTYDAVASILGKFARHTPQNSRTALLNKRVSELDPTILERILAKMARVNKPTTCNSFNRAVQAAFNWAASRYPDRTPPVLITANPFRGVRGPSVPRSPERYAERAEVAAFLRWAWRRSPRFDERGRRSLTSQFDRHICLLVRLEAHTGARPAELCIPGRRFRPDVGFTWECWNPVAAMNSFGHWVGLIKLEKHKTSRKTGRAREIVVPPILTRAIERHRARDWAHPTWVFNHRRGRGWEGRGVTTAEIGEPIRSQYLCVKIRRWRAEAVAEGLRLKNEGKPTRGLDLIQDAGDNRFVLYRLRHTRITDLIGVNGGLSYDQAAALTGTSGKMIETTYGHLTGSRLIDLDQSARGRRR